MRIPQSLAMVVFFCSILLVFSSPCRASKVNYRYDSLNRLIQVTYPDGSTIDYTYDPSGNRLSRIVQKLPAPILPDVKINGLEGPVLVKVGHSIEVSVGVGAGDSKNASADWWIVADSPWGWFHWDEASGSWLPGISVAYQGPLFDIHSVDILDVSGLPPGTYTFYFGMDLKMNGILDLDSLSYDAAKLIVEE